AAADARRIEREKAHWCGPLAALIRAALAAGEGRTEAASARLARAAHAFEHLDMRLYAATARRRAGELIRGDARRRLIARAGHWMKSQEIADPQAMTDLHVPWLRPR